MGLLPGDEDAWRFWGSNPRVVTRPAGEDGTSVSSLDVSLVRSTTETLRGCVVPWLAWPVAERAPNGSEAVRLSLSVSMLD
jgi:hypothetical protein